eukprot:427523_1
MATDETDETTPGFEQLLEMVKMSLNGIFNDEQLSECVYKVLEDGFEENEEVLEDLQEYEDCTIVFDSTKEIIENINNNKIKYKWNETTDQQILYELLLKIFKDNITNISTLISLFSKSDAPLLPNLQLIECTNNNILTIACIVTKELNKSSKKQINMDNVRQLIIEEKLNGNILSNMKPKEFHDNYLKKYKIASAKGRKLFNGITQYCNNRQSNIENINENTINEYKNNYDNLTCNVIKKIARDLANGSLYNIHDKISKTIKKNSIDGKLFMNKFNKINEDNPDEFNEFKNDA